MKCSRCGAEFEGNFCPECGARAAVGPAADTSVRAVGQSDPAQVAAARPAGNSAEKKKKLLILCAGIAAVALVAIIIGIAVSGSVGYKGVVRKVMKGYENINALNSGMFLSVMSNVYSLEDGVEGKLDAAEECADFIEDHLYYEFDIDEDVKYKSSYKIVSKVSLGSYVREIKEELEDEDIDPGLISDFMVVTVEVKVKTGGVSKTDNVYLMLTKEKGSWKLDDITDDSPF